MKTFTVTAPELRFVDKDAGVFTGYASVFGEVNRYGEIMQRGAFKDSLAKRSRDVGLPMLWNHDPDQPIGIWTSLAEDEKGLSVTGRLLTETAKGSEIYALMSAGAVAGLSIGFFLRGDKRGANGTRIITSVDLFEISVTSVPVDQNARVTHVRSFQRQRVLSFNQAAISAARSIRLGIKLDESTKKQAGR